jgi:hypothetical protein
MRLKPLLTVAAGLCAVFAMISLAVSGGIPGLGRGRGGPTRSKPAPLYASYLQVAGIQPMAFDPANTSARRDGDAWVLGDIDLEQARVLADDTQDLDVLAQQDPRWIPTQTWKLRHGGASPFAVAKEHCSMQHLQRMENLCKNDIDVVVERTDRDAGRVVYARPRYNDAMDDECRAYADCVAKNGWLGRESPLPADAAAPDELHGFKAGDIHIPVQGSKAELQAGFQDSIAVCKRNLTALHRLGQSNPDDPSITQNIILNEDLLEQLEWLMSL